MSKQRCRWCARSYDSLRALGAGVYSNTEYCSARCESRGKRNKPNSKDGEKVITWLIGLSIILTLIAVFFFFILSPGMMIASMW